MSCPAHGWFLSSMRIRQQFWPEQRSSKLSAFALRQMFFLLWTSGWSNLHCPPNIGRPLHPLPWAQYGHTWSEQMAAVVAWPTSMVLFTYAFALKDAMARAKESARDRRSEVNKSLRYSHSLSQNGRSEVKK